MVVSNAGQRISPRLLRVLSVAALVVCIGVSAEAEQSDRVALMIEASQTPVVAMQRDVARMWLDAIQSDGTPSVTVSVSSFAAKVFDHGMGQSGLAEDHGRLRRLVSQAESYASVVDFEVAFHRIADMADSSGLAAALLFGADDFGVVDRSTKQIAAPLRSDSRYADINASYMDFVSAKASQQELLSYFEPFYRERNASLLADDLVRLHRTLGARLVVIDVSGRSAFLKNAAQKAGATYVPFADQSRERMVKTLSRLTSGSPEAVGEGTKPPQRGADASDLLIVSGAMAVLAGGVVINVMRRRKIRPRSTAPELVAWEIEPDDIPAPAPPPPPPPIVRLPIVSFELRTEVPPGSIIVVWRDGQGRAHEGEGVAVTFDSVVFFPGSPWSDGRVETITCLPLGLNLNVITAELIFNSDGTITVVPTQFANEFDDRMAMTTILTHAGEG